GNAMGEGAMEIAVGGMELTAEEGAVALGYAGGGFAVSRDGRSLAPSGRVQLNPGDRFAVRPGHRGSWFYVSASGGLDLVPVLGSLATSVRTGIGGIEGRQLAVGDILPLRRLSHMPELSLTPAAETDRRIRIVLGPQDDYFTAAGLDAFFSQPYRVSSRSDRMAYLLEGPVITHAGGYDIVSDGIALGAIQVPGDARPIVLMADRQRTGGYPKLGHVIRADIGRLAQCRPGDTIEFAAVTVERARAELLGVLGSLESTLERCTAVAPNLSSEFLLAQTLISGVRNAAAADE